MGRGKGGGALWQGTVVCNGDKIIIAGEEEERGGRGRGVKVREYERERVGKGRERGGRWEKEGDIL